jgi:hypothetical protein
MSENLAPTQQIDAVSEIKESSVAPVEEVGEKKEAESVKDADFKFFKCCSASLKRFSLLIFVINVFLCIALAGIAVILCAVYLGVEMLSLLALPIITVFIILVVLARFLSALVYGFAEIVEKSEK